MLRTVHLHGELGEKYGKSFSLEVESPGEAIRALITQIPGLERSIREGEFVCVRGSLDSGVYCEEPHLYLTFGKLQEFHIMPAVGGSGRGGGKILLGIALIAATVFSGGTALAAGGLFFGGAQGLGISGLAGAAFGGGVMGAISGGASLGMLALVGGGLLVAAGAAAAISAIPDSGDYGDRNEVDQRPGYLFNGAVNTGEQGGACPVVFGRVLAGSVVASSGINSERVAVNAGPRTPPGNAGQIGAIADALPFIVPGGGVLADQLLNEL